MMVLRCNEISTNAYHISILNDDNYLRIFLIVSGSILVMLVNSYVFLKRLESLVQLVIART